MLIGLWVDDSFIVGAMKLRFELFMYLAQDSLKSKSKTGQIHITWSSYTNLEDGSLVISLPLLEDLIIEDFGGIQGPKAEHPYYTALPEDGDEDYLSQEDADRLRSGCAKLSFLAIGARHEMRFAISALARNQRSPKVIDWKCLMQMVSYLRGNLHLGARTVPSDSQLHISSDSSTFKYEDSRGQSGTLWWMGDHDNAPIYTLDAKHEVAITSALDGELVSLARTSKLTTIVLGLCEVIEIQIGQCTMLLL